MDLKTIIYLLTPPLGYHRRCDTFQDVLFSSTQQRSILEIHENYFIIIYSKTLLIS